MADPLRPTPEKARRIYQKSIHIWNSLYSDALDNPVLPQFCFRFENAIKNQPYFPPRLSVRPCLHYPSVLGVNGKSIFNISEEEACQIPPLVEELELAVSAKAACSVILSTSSTTSCQGWFKSPENHLAVLVLAWSYIFSARWAELFFDATTVYTDNSTQLRDGCSIDTLEINIGDASNDEARWWSAVLAPGGGWKAYSSHEGSDKYLSPWSVSPGGSHAFTISCHIEKAMNDTIPPCSATALDFLSHYCHRHDIWDQYITALSCVVCLPLCQGRVDLPMPSFQRRDRSGTTVPGLNKYPAGPYCKEYGPETGKFFHHPPHFIDKLITLSCNSRGVMSLLSSAFADPDVPCNCASPWLQACFAVLDSVEDELIFTRILAGRYQHLAFLWLGAVTLGIQKTILMRCRLGMIPVDIHAAWWSGTLVSFIQKPSTQPLVKNNTVQRSDECRLLYWTRSRRHHSLPVNGWMPFGATPLEETDIEVRLHVNCSEHTPRFVGFNWDCQGGLEYLQEFDGQQVIPCRPNLSIEAKRALNFEAFRPEQEDASANATRCVFAWLRSGSFPAHERDIYEDDWLNVEDSDGDGSSAESTDKSSTKSSLKKSIDAWIEGTTI